MTMSIRNNEQQDVLQPRDHVVQRGSNLFEQGLSVAIRTEITKDHALIVPSSTVLDLAICQGRHAAHIIQGTHSNVFDQSSPVPDPKYVLRCSRNHVPQPFSAVLYQTWLFARADIRLDKRDRERCFTGRRRQKKVIVLFAHFHPRIGLTSP